MKAKLLEPELYTEAPRVCLKPGCEGTIFLRHEEGWQCFNCMKIVYKANRPMNGSGGIKRHARDNN